MAKRKRDHGQPAAPQTPPPASPFRPQPAEVAPTAPAGPKSTTFIRQIHRQNRYFLAFLLLAVSLLVLPIFKLFAIPFLVAGTLVTLLYPLYRWFLKKLWKNRFLSALACCLVLVLAGAGTAYFLGYVVVQQAVDFYTTVEPKVLEIVKKGDEGVLGEIQQSRYLSWIPWGHINWRAWVQDAAKNAASIGTFLVNKTSVSLATIVANVFITLFTMFYLFIDGEKFLLRLNYLIPMRQEYKELIYTRFLGVSRATVKTTLVIAMVQASLGSIVLLIAGIKTWLLWGFIMAILSIIPLVGAWAVLIPAGIIQLILGNLWQGIFILAASAVVVSNVDNILRPRLVGQESKLHDLVIFFATIGGIAAFGPMGFIVGPVVASLFVTIVEIYGMEFKEYLDEGEAAARGEE
jgi:predicted PurR-regulated permease PerM